MEIFNILRKEGSQMENLNVLEDDTYAQEVRGLAMEKPKSRGHEVKAMNEVLKRVLKVTKHSVSERNAK